MTRPFVPTAALLVVLAGCMAAPPPVPEMPTERVPRPPAAAVTLIWQPGHYDWNGAGYQWAPGKWVPTEGHRRLWQDGIWRRDGNAWVWDPAHWL